MKTLLFICLLCLSGNLLDEKPIPLILRNSSLKAINLVIPGVMNPPLSPMSSSGVSLEKGQKIFFFHKNKQYLLLVVDDNKERKTLKVPTLIKKRKIELGLSSSRNWATI